MEVMIMINMIKKNPVIYSDFPDPDIIRVEDTYYMASTTMHFMPGCDILRSYDLMNWEFVTHAYDMLAKKPSLHGLQVGVAAYAVSWLQNNPEHQTIKQVLEERGFVNYMSQNPLDKEDFLKAMRYTPNVKENYYTILSDPDNIKKLIEFVETDEYFSKFIA
jgi:hypothetical protein